MSENIFKFDDTYWLQKNGAAMGTNSTPPYAELYFRYHEMTYLYPLYRKLLKIYGRFIDDGFVAWYDINASPPSSWKTNFKFLNFIEDLKFDALTFKVKAPADT